MAGGPVVGAPILPVRGRRESVHARHAESAAAGLPVFGIADEPRGMREFRLTDPSGNVVRLGGDS